MELNQLNYFRTVARLQNVTKAAEELCISQPNLSTAITKLESSLGVSLFERKKGKIKLTGNGELFLTHVNRALHELESGLDLIKERSEHGSDRVAFGSAFGGLPEILFSGWSASRPSFSCSQLVYNNAMLERMLLEKTLDFAVMNRRPENSELEWIPLFSDGLAVAMPPDNRHAEEDILDITELDGDRFICNEALFDEASLEALCRHADFIPDIARICNNYGFPGFDLRGLDGCLLIHPFFFSHNFIDCHGKNIAVKRLGNRFCRAEIGLVKLKVGNMNPLSADFYEYVRRELPVFLAGEQALSESVI